MLKLLYRSVLALVLVICVCTIASASDLGLILKVGSTYKDQGDSRMRTTEYGTGVLMDIPSLSSSRRPSQFLITAAHLVQGKNPWVEVGGRKVKPLSVLSDAEDDIAIVQIPATEHAGAYAYMPEQRERNAEDPFFQERMTLLRCHTDKARWSCGWNRSDEYNLVSAGFSSARLLSPKWSNDGSKEALEVDASKVGDTSFLQNFYSPNFFGSAVKMPITAAPGNSGSLVIIDFGKFFGLPVESNYFFRRSKVVTAATIERLIAQFAAGARHFVGKARWKMRNGILYRDFGDGLIESDFINVPTGNGISSSPGTSLPIGNGISSSPGRPCQSSVALPLSQRQGSTLRSAVNASRIFLDRNRGIDPSSVFRYLGLSSDAMSLNGKPVYGFRVRSRLNPNEEYTLYPNVEAHQWQEIVENSRNYEITPIQKPLDFIDLFHQKLQDKRRADGLPEKSQDSIQSWSQNESLTNSDLDRGIYGKGEVEIEGDHIHVLWNVQDMLPGVRPVDRIDFTLDRYGRLPGQKKFTPIVRVSGANGSSYYIDLRPLFFTDLSNPLPRKGHTAIDGSFVWDADHPDLRAVGGQMGLFLHTINSSDVNQKGVERVMRF